MAAEATEAVAVAEAVAVVAMRPMRSLPRPRDAEYTCPCTDVYSASLGLSREVVDVTATTITAIAIAIATASVAPAAVVAIVNSYVAGERRNRQGRSTSLTVQRLSARQVLGTTRKTQGAKSEGKQQVPSDGGGEEGRERGLGFC